MLLAQYFIQKHTHRVGRRVTTIAKDALAKLTQYRWPGSIRELENIIERGLVLSKGDMFELEDKLLPTSPVVHPSTTEPQTMEEVERAHLTWTLERTEWVIAGPKGAAHLLGLNPNTLRSRLVKLGVTRSTREIS